jgi:uncharacterized protein (DUF2062 family)
MDDTDRMIAGLLGWLLIGAIPIALVINLIVQSLNRPWRKYQQHRKVHARWREIVEGEGK